jgi:hypothetical protein
MPRPALAASFILAALFSGCGEEREDKLATPEAQTTAASDQQGIDVDLANLARGKDVTRAEDMAAYDEAVRRLIARGSAIEGTVIDSLRRSPDWAVRLGCVEILQGIGTRLCVDHLITVLDDREPLVALRATTTLEELTKHREIPQPGQPVGANGLPPVQPRDPKDLSMEADARIWAAWHGTNAVAHKAAWTAWWTANSDKTPVL